MWNNSSVPIMCEHGVKNKKGNCSYEINRLHVVHAYSPDDLHYYQESWDYIVIATGSSSQHNW